MLQRYALAALTIIMLLASMLAAYPPSAMASKTKTDVEEFAIRKEVDVRRESEITLIPGVLSFGYGVHLNTGVELPFEIRIACPAEAVAGEEYTINITVRGLQGALAWFSLNGSLWLSIDLPSTGAYTTSWDLAINESVAFTTPLGRDYHQEITYNESVARWDLPLGLGYVALDLVALLDLTTTTYLSATVEIGGDGVAGPHTEEAVWDEQGEELSFSFKAAGPGTVNITMRDIRFCLEKLTLVLEELCVRLHGNITGLGSFSYLVAIDIPDVVFEFGESEVLYMALPLPAGSATADASGEEVPIHDISVSFPVVGPEAGRGLFPLLLGCGAAALVAGLAIYQVLRSRQQAQLVLKGLPLPKVLGSEAEGEAGD